MPLPKLVATWKAIPAGIRWTDAEPDGYARFYTPLEIEGIVEAGLVLSGGAYIHHPDRHVSFELAVLGATGKRRTPLVRYDWRDLKGGHSNRRTVCRALGSRTPSTHLHSFEVNWVESERRMRRGNLPCAEAVNPEPQTFEELRDDIGSLFRIKNIDVVSRPRWEYDLFQ